MTIAHIVVIETQLSFVSLNLLFTIKIVIIICIEFQLQRSYTVGGDYDGRDLMCYLVIYSVIPYDERKNPFLSLYI